MPLSLQNLVRIEGLQQCPQLQHLWLFENKISSMWGLQGCSQLERLFLYSNSISQIEGLETLTKLQVNIYMNVIALLLPEASQLRGPPVAVLASQAQCNLDDP